MKPEGQYDAKLGCDNCGMEDFYKIPFGYEFLSFIYKEDNNGIDHVYSRIRRGISEETAPERALNCHNCQFPCLVLCGWNKTDLPKLPQWMGKPNTDHSPAA